MLNQLTASALLLALAHSLSAAPLTEARVNKIINDVTVVHPEKGGRTAKLHDVIDEQTAVKTGIKSRSELLFQDNTLTRIGPETFFSFTPGTREMALEKGTLLLQVPKGLGGAKIRTAAVTAASTGTTIMLEHRPGKHLKVLVLEGSLRLSVNGRFGDSLLLTPGKMVIMPPDAKRIPDPIAVDIAHVVNTSSLVKMSRSDALPSMALIQREIDLQARSVASARLIPTNLVINGSGTDVMMTEEPPVAALSPRQSVEPRSTDLPLLALSGSTSVAGRGATANGVATGSIDATAVLPGRSNNGNGLINGNGAINGNAGSNGNENGNQSANGNGRGLGNGGPAPVTGAPGRGR